MTSAVPVELAGGRAETSEQTEQQRHFDLDVFERWCADFVMSPGGELNDVSPPRCGDTP